jgi:hypothetical protein
MPDREKVIKGVHDASRYLEDREWVDKSVGVHIDALNDALAMLKEDCHNCKLECLLQKYDELKEKYDALLKEQETELCDRCGRRRLKSNRVKGR